jgi:hypothetical protein
MARRRQNEASGVFVLAALFTGGIGWILKKGEEVLKGSNVANIVLVRRWLDRREAMRIRHLLLVKVYVAINEHLAVLATKQMRDLRNLDANVSSRGAIRAPADVVGRELSISSSPIPIASFDNTRWRALLKRDPQLELVANKLQPLGQKWVDQFAASYLAFNDKKHLPDLVSTIIGDARREYEQRRAAS